MHAVDMPDDCAAGFSVVKAAVAFMAAAACLAARSSANDSANVAECQGSCFAKCKWGKEDNTFMCCSCKACVMMEQVSENRNERKEQHCE